MRVDPTVRWSNGRDHLAGGHVAHRTLHRMAVVIEADREQFVLTELIHRRCPVPRIGGAPSSITTGSPQTPPWAWCAPLHPTDRVRHRRAEDRYGELAVFDAHTHPAGMFAVTEAEAAAIRAVFEQRGEFSAAIDEAPYESHFQPRRRLPPLFKRLPCRESRAILTHRLEAVASCIIP
jgi:hypothetical protein